MPTSILPHSTPVSEWDIYAMHMAWRRFESAQRFAPEPEPSTVAMGKSAELAAWAILKDRGYSPSLTSHKAACDLRIGQCRIEVKCARWDPLQGRYQFHLRSQRQRDADLLLLACLGDDGEPVAWFCIPGPLKVKNIAVWSADPFFYIGKWTPYLENWTVADEVIGQRRGAYQLPLF